MPPLKALIHVRLDCHLLSSSLVKCFYLVENFSSAEEVFFLSLPSFHPHPSFLVDLTGQVSPKVIGIFVSLQ